MVVHACNPSNEEAEAGESHISSQELIAEAKSWRWRWLPILYKVSSGGCLFFSVVMRSHVGQAGL